MCYSARTAGFTLVELSIVLVIIGLLVGGILMGADLIGGAQVRAQISQMEKYQIAVNTFRVKYNALPGIYGRLPQRCLDSRQGEPVPDGVTATVLFRAPTVAA